MALFGTGFFQNSAARHHNVATALVHFQDLEGLGYIHQWRNIADRADIHLTAGKKRNGTVKINGKSTLDPTEDDTFNALIGFE